MVVVIGYAFDNGDLVDSFLLIAGVILAPIWGIWLALLFSRMPAPPAANHAGVEEAATDLS